MKGKLSFPQQENFGRILPYYTGVATVGISFPRSGRTWIRFILHEILCQMNLERKYREVTWWKHNGTMLNYPDQSYRSSKSFFDDKRVLLLVRDPRDVIVSYFYFLKYRKSVHWLQELTVEDYFIHDLGLRFVVRFMNDWIFAKKIVKDLAVIFYEDVVADPLTAIRYILWYTKMPYVSDKKILEAVRACSVEEMRRIDVEERLPREKHAQIENPLCRDVREARIGGYVDHVDAKTIAWANRYLKEHLNEFYSRYYAKEASGG